MLLTRNALWVVAIGIANSLWKIEASCDLCKDSILYFDGSGSVLDFETFELLTWTCQEYVDEVNATTIEQDSQACIDAIFAASAFCCLSATPISNSTTSQPTPSIGGGGGGGGGSSPASTPAPSPLTSASEQYSSSTSCNFCYDSSFGTELDGTASVVDPDTFEFMTCQDYADKLDVANVPQDSPKCIEAIILTQLICCYVIVTDPPVSEPSSSSSVSGGAEGSSSSSAGGGGVGGSSSLSSSAATRTRNVPNWMGGSIVCRMVLVMIAIVLCGWCHCD